MKTAAEFYRGLVTHHPEDSKEDCAALEADREVRAAAFNMAADLFGALVRHSVDGYVRLTSVRNQLLALVAKERDQ